MFKNICAIRFLFAIFAFTILIPNPTMSQTTIRVLLWLSDDCYNEVVNQGYNPRTVMQTVFNNCNTAFSNRPGVNLQLAGILHYTGGTIEDYTQTIERFYYSTALINFKNMAEPGPRRDECAADQCVMAIDNNFSPSSIGGMAYGVAYSPVGASNAYCVVRWSCAIWDDLTTAHELAHHFGTVDPDPIGDPGRLNQHGIKITNPLNPAQQVATIEEYIVNDLTPYAGKIIYFSENGYVPPNNVSWGVPLTNPNGHHGVTQIQNTSATVAGYRNLQNTTNLQNFTLGSNEYFNPVANNTLSCSNVTVNNGGELDLRSNGAVNITSLTLNAGGILNITSGAGSCIPKHRDIRGGADKPPVVKSGDAATKFSLLMKKLKGRYQLYYTLPVSAPVEIKIFSINGREVGHFSKGWLNKGEYFYELPRSMPSNTYFFRMAAGDFTINQRFVIIQ